MSTLDLCALRDTNRIKYNLRSAQIFHPGKAQDAEAEHEGQSLPLFGSTSWAAQTAGPNKRQKTQKEDLLFYVGGAVWALDWCPACGNVLAVLLWRRLSKLRCSFHRDALLQTAQQTMKRSPRSI